MINKKKILPLMVVGIMTVSSVLFYQCSHSVELGSYLNYKDNLSVEDVVTLYGQNAVDRLAKNFSQAKINYPPEKVTLIAFKDKKVLNLWCSSGQRDFTLVKSYKIKGASGVLGPKLKEGDRQVPEGVYKIEGLNPNSNYHLSMKLNYPNLFDLKYAKLEGRKNPGTNIFIHGDSRSIGCLAMGDKAIEELFILSEQVGLDNIEVIIAPTNLAKFKNMRKLLKNKPAWVTELYRSIKLSLGKYYKVSKN